MAMTCPERSSDLTFSLMEVHRQMRVILAAVARDAGVTAQQIELLCILERGQPTPGELATLLGCDKTNITGMVARLAQRGLVDRRPDTRDRRIIHLQLTDQGRHFSHQLKQEVATRVHTRWNSVTEHQRAALADLAGHHSPPDRAAVNDRTPAEHLNTQ